MSATACFQDFWPSAPAISDTGLFHVDGRVRGRHSGGLARHWNFGDLSNIGTLFAFALVAGGVLILRYREPDRPRAFVHQAAR